MLTLDTKIYVAGKICSGKSTLAKKIAEHTGYPLISFGGILKDHLVRSDLPVTRESLQRIGQELIDQLGYDGFLRWSIEHSPQIQWNGPLIVYCVCDLGTQLARLMTRDQLDENDARETLSHETEQYVSELEASANLFFRPGDSADDFLAQLDALIKQQQ